MMRFTYDDDDDDDDDGDRFGFEQPANSPLAPHHPPTASSSSPTTNSAPPRTNPFTEVMLLVACCLALNLTFLFHFQL